MEDTSPISFHEATIRDIRCSSRSIFIFIDEALVGDQKRSVMVEFCDVTGISRDGIHVDSLRMEYEDAEILTLNMTSTVGELIVVWNDFSKHESETRAYTVECARISVST